MAFETPGSSFNEPEMRLTVKETDRGLTDRGLSVLIVGHGTRNPSGAAQLRSLVAQVCEQAPGVRIAGCFLELAEPLIPESIAELAQRGTKQLIVVPVLLFTAGHAKTDIPDEVATACAPYGIEVVGQTSSLGTRQSVLELSRDRFQEVLDAKCKRCTVGVCPVSDCRFKMCDTLGTDLGRVGLAMIGRGTSDAEALDHMRQFTELRVGLTPVHWGGTGFFAGGTPRVDALLEESATVDCDTVVVQPHLLFEGELMDQLRGKVLEMRSKYPNKKWFITRTLGADPKLASVFVGMIQSELDRCSA